MSTFRAGAARRCITPSLGCHIAGYFHDRIARDIHDDLFARALVLENGETTLALVVCDLIALPQADVEAAKEQASRLTGIPQGNILIACTHTHYGPSPAGLLGTPRDEAYMAQAPAWIAESVRLAQGRLQPAQVGVAAGHCPGESFNRRWHMADGSVRANFSIGHLNPQALRPAGPTDPEVPVLAVCTLEGDPIALLANYALHYVDAGEPEAISANYFGYFDRVLQRLVGRECVGILANGCCGDVNNINIARPRPGAAHPYEPVERVANVVAAAAYGAWQGLRDFEYDRHPALGAATEGFCFRRRRSSTEELAQARALATQPQPAAQSPAFTAWIYAQEALLVDQEPLETPAPLQALRIGELGLVGIPGEAFVEYGLQIKQQSPFAPTMTIELANGYLGYLPTDRALSEGSYETQLARSSKAAPGTEGAIVAAALSALRRLEAQGDPKRCSGR